MNRNEKVISTMQAAMKKACRSRLRRIEGQVRGLLRMIDDDRYCIEVIDQVQAVAAALKKVEGEILNDHISHCVEHAIRGGDRDVQRDKMLELVKTLSRTR